MVIDHSQRGQRPSTLLHTRKKAEGPAGVARGAFLSFARAADQRRTRLFSRPLPDREREG